MSRKRTAIGDTHAHVSDALRLSYTSREPQVEKKEEITAALYAIARECGWVLGEFHWRTYPMSFHWVDVRLRDREFAILIGEASPVAALSSTVPDFLNLVFFDNAAFAEAARKLQAPFVVLSASELARPLSEMDRAFVDQLIARREIVKPWTKPDTVGDVIFNWWD